MSASLQERIERMVPSGWGAAIQYDICSDNLVVRITSPGKRWCAHAFFRSEDARHLRKRVVAPMVASISQKIRHPRMIGSARL